MTTKTRIVSLFITGLLLFSNLIFVSAQSGSIDSDASTVIVNGKILNMNQPGKVPGNLETMLHYWDQNKTEKPTLYGKSAADGTFHFENVRFVYPMYYSAMVVYEGVTYSSADAATIGNGNGTVELAVPIYESTNDTAQVQINNEFVNFTFTPGGISVGEKYVLSNYGALTVKDTVALESGKQGALQFYLPENAQNTSFETNEKNRFVISKGSFVDMEPFIPGEQSRLIQVDFVVPYDENNNFLYQVPYETNQIYFRLPESDGVTLSGENITQENEIKTNTGANLLVYSARYLKSGQTLKVTFSGKPKIAAIGATAEIVKPGSENGGSFPIEIAAGLLVLALIAVGVWLWQRRLHHNIREASN